MSFCNRAAPFFLALLFGCSGEVSIALVFPNEVALGAARRLEIEAYDPETSSSSGMARDCSGFSAKAAKGERPLGTPDRADLKCTVEPCAMDWFADEEIKKVEAGKKVVYVLGYASADESATPFLEGCSDRFDSAGSGEESVEVPVELKLVIPGSARLVKSAGDRQVGRAGDPLGVPLTIRVEADPPSGSGGRYPIPGVALVYTSKNTDFVIQTGDDPIRYATYSDRSGVAAIQVRLPAEPAEGEVEVEAQALEATGVPERAKATFSLSVTAPIVFATKEVIIPPGGGRPMAAALGQIIPGGPKELAILGCSGDDTTCRRGIEAAAPFGETLLTVLTDLGGAKRQVPVTLPVEGLGILPAGIAVANLTAAAGDDIGIVNSRREICQARSCLPNAPCSCYRPDPSVQIDCPCEGAEVLTLSASNGTVHLDQRQTMTGSNAVALAAVKQGDTSPLLNIVVAAQGRSKQERPCAINGSCMLPYEAPGCDLNDPTRTCGCPPAERCECAGGDCSSGLGVCTAQDKMIDMLAHRPTAELYNRFGCQAAVLSCDKSAPAASSCQCLDRAERENACQGHDNCGCKVPNRITLGEIDSPLPPNGVAAGQLQGNDQWDLVVPTVGGLGLLESKTNTYDWVDQPIINAPIDATLVVQIDNHTAGEGPDAPADIVWYARKGCTPESNFVERCPIWRPLAEGEEAQGCLGVYFTAGARSLLDLSSTSPGGCRRHLLTYPPDGICTGDFNDDGALDVALSSRVSNALQVYAGDGRGGLLDPPETIPLPGGAGGPMVCGDVDGDELPDVVVLDLVSGNVQIVRSGS